MGFGGGFLKGATSGGLQGPNSILKHPSLSNLIAGGTNILGGGDKKKTPPPTPMTTTPKGGQSLTSTDNNTSQPLTEDTGPNVLK